MRGNLLRFTVGIAFASLSLPVPDIKLCTEAAAPVTPSEREGVGFQEGKTQMQRHEAWPTGLQYEHGSKNKIEVGGGTRSRGSEIGLTKE